MFLHPMVLSIRMSALTLTGLTSAACPDICTSLIRFPILARLFYLVALLALPLLRQVYQTCILAPRITGACGLTMVLIRLPGQYQPNLPQQTSLPMSHHLTEQ